MKKEQNLQPNSGITVCDSIVMSVKRKRINLRQLEAIAIAVAGYTATIMVFVKMFQMRYNEAALAFAAVAFSIIYIFISLMKKQALLLTVGTVIAGGFISSRHLGDAAMGFKYVYNVIYRASYHTEIDYYKFLKAESEAQCITTFLVMCAWLAALVIYIFTIYHPHPLPPLIVTFPILEIGMYNGLEVNIFWGMLAVAFLIACFAMSTIDMGEYSGGSGGFVRKENLFFPKRQMRLKVTEKCGVYLILVIITVSGLTAAVMKATGYKRSEEINRKRIEVRDAVNSFSVENLADSISDLTSAFGLTIKLDSHKLGKISTMKYKDKTDLVVTLDGVVPGAVYLKEYTGSVYGDNEWRSLPDSQYRLPIFNDFKDYSIYPQDFPYRFNKLFNRYDPEYTITISSKLKGGRSFAPYGIDNIGSLTYDRDCEVTSRKNAQREFTYKFSKVNAEYVSYFLGASARSVYSLDNVSDADWREVLKKYGNDKSLLSYDSYLTIDTELPGDTQLLYDNPALILTELIQEDYEDFVYDHYLQLPDDTNMTEVREEFADILDYAHSSDDAVTKVNTLTALRNRISSISEYSLNPGKTPNNRDFVNYFLLENHKGYCTHYATSGVVLARMAGIPARYATGYVIVGDDFNTDNQNEDGSFTINVKDNRSHAWTEVYLDGYGWVPFEFTAGYSDQTINTTPTTTAPPDEPAEDDTVTTAASRTPRPSTTRDRSATTASDQNATEAAPTSAASTGKQGIGGGWGHTGGSLRIPNGVKYAIYTILLIAFVIFAVIARRQLILRYRRKRFSEGSAVSRMGFMFDHMIALLEFIHIDRYDMEYTKFADHVEERLGGIYFPGGSFSAFMDVSLRAAFSPGTPDNSELAGCSKLTDDTAKVIYERASFMQRLYMKYMLCLI